MNIQFLHLMLWNMVSSNSLMYYCFYISFKTLTTFNPLEKSLIERMMQYFKDRTENFDDYYPCNNNKKRNCDLQYVYNWIKIFVYAYNTTVTTNKIPFLLERGQLSLN